jgi:hypothetical protein
MISTAMGGDSFGWTQPPSNSRSAPILWDKLLADGGSPSRCGWLKDRWGLSWQIVPSVLPKLMADPSGRVMQAMMQMTKLEIQELPAFHLTKLRRNIISTKVQRITGWVLTCLVGLFLIGVSAIGKFTDFPDKEVMFKKIGVPMELSSTLGVIEVAVTLLFLIPRTSFLGAILVTGYLGGAVWTHLRVGDLWFFPIIIGVVMWIALGLRQPAIFALALGKPHPSKAE